MQPFIAVTTPFMKCFGLELLFKKAQAVVEPLQKRLTLKEYELLIELLSANENKNAVQQNESVLLELPLPEWLSKVKELAAAKSFVNEKSVQEYLAQLALQYGAPKMRQYSTDITMLDKRFHRTFHEA